VKSLQINKEDALVYSKWRMVKGIVMIVAVNVCNCLLVLAHMDCPGIKRWLLLLFVYNHVIFVDVCCSV